MLFWTLMLSFLCIAVTVINVWKLIVAQEVHISLYLILEKSIATKTPWIYWQNLLLLNLLPYKPFRNVYSREATTGEWDSVSKKTDGPPRERQYKEGSTGPAV